MSNIIVQKYGGSSVAEPKRILKVAKRIVSYRRKGYDLVIVVSALGDTTDELLKLAYKISRSPSEREIDMLISTGEQISVSLLAMAIHKLGYEAISFTGAQAGIITDSTYTRARIIRINSVKIRKQLAQKRIVIVAGFQGVDLSREITTLGRGGSDLTAVALAKVLKAKSCEIYTDVEGIYTADPRIVRGARKLESISYDEMLEMASLGAQVLQTRCVELAKRFNIPIIVRSSFTPLSRKHLTLKGRPSCSFLRKGLTEQADKGGTMISAEVKAMEKVVVSAVTLNRNEAKITMRDVPDKPGVAAKIFKTIASQGVNVDMIVQNISRTGSTDLSFTVTKENLAKTIKVAKKASAQIGGGSVIADRDIARVSVVGVGMKSHSGIAAGMFEALAESKINIEMISTSEISISCVIRKKFAQRAVRAIHKKFKLEKK
ncbi:MAG: aspartate kinase [Candidatus Omnitrophica bacterium]|nr:aspartate kinase [Candidatus Omnitrophota bacterium]